MWNSLLKTWDVIYVMNIDIKWMLNWSAHK